MERGMRRERSRSRATTDTNVSHDNNRTKGKSNSRPDVKSPWRAAVDWVVMLFVLVYVAYFAHSYQSTLPRAKSAQDAGLTGFSEELALKHVRALTKFGPHPVGSTALEDALEYVLSQIRLVESAANPNVDVEISHLAADGYNRMKGGGFPGRTLVYSNLRSVVVRVCPRHSTESAEDNAILVSSHVDSVVTTAGAGDCSSCVAVMLELVRVLSHSAQKLRHSVIFLFNTGEEEGMIGAHSFITQHPWRDTVRAFIDLESSGVGGKSFLFQGPDEWLVKAFSEVAPYPALQISAQDLFHSGFVKSHTDFQVYREVGGLSGLDFAYIENQGVYHTKNDKLELLRSGSLQHLGDNMVACLMKVASAPEFVTINKINVSEVKTLHSKMEMVYFDILGKYSVVYTKDFAKVLHTTLLLQMLLLFVGSICAAGLPAIVSLILAMLTLVLTWASSIGSAVIISFVLPHVGSHAVPYIANPWLCIGLFGAPALFGALLGNWLGRAVLLNYLLKTKSVNDQIPRLAFEWEAERWLFKAGLVQWMAVLAVGTWGGAGSTYLALSWILFPGAAYGLLNYHSPRRQSRSQLSLLSFWVGIIPPTILSAPGIFILPRFVIDNLVHFDRIPGGSPIWLSHVLVAGVISAIICLWMAYLWPFAHRWGGLIWIIIASLLVTAGALLVVYFQVFPAFTKDIGRGVNVVQVVETSAIPGSRGESYISLAAVTPGNLDHELKVLADEGFVCGGGPDFVSYHVKYGCKKFLDLDLDLWEKRPALVVESDEHVAGVRSTIIILDAGSSHRWQLAIDTDKIQALSIERTDNSEILVPENEVVGVDGWHLIQFTTDGGGPHKFRLKLLWWAGNAGAVTGQKDDKPLLKLRTDVNLVTDEVASILEKLPECSLFGKSTAPYTTAYLSHMSLK